jgi:hypothetical protein
VHNGALLIGQNYRWEATMAEEMGGDTGEQNPSFSDIGGEQVEPGQQTGIEGGPDVSGVD